MTPDPSIAKRPDWGDEYGSRNRKGKGRGRRYKGKDAAKGRRDDKGEEEEEGKGESTAVPEGVEAVAVAETLEQEKKVDSCMDVEEAEDGKTMDVLSVTAADKEGDSTPKDKAEGDTMSATANLISACAVLTLLSLPFCATHSVALRSFHFLILPAGAASIIFSGGMTAEKKPAVPLRTVESELLEALFKAGCINSGNKGDLKRLGYSRSSRTDKGVHAVKTLVCMKLLVPPGDQTELGSFPSLPALINAQCPPDLRVFSVCRVPKSFDSRNTCSWREYRYYMPKSIIGNDGQVEKLHRLLQKFQGTHSFANLVNLKGHKSARKCKEVQQEAIKLDAGEEVMLTLQASSMPANIYLCEVCEKGVTIDGSEFVGILLKGQAFQYNQIRLMVGCAIAVLLGRLPEWWLGAALDSPYKVVVPLAPPDGLMLCSQGFTRHSNGLVLDPGDMIHSNGTTVTYGEDNSKMGCLGRMQCAMTGDELGASNKYLHDFILKQVCRNWIEGNKTQEFATYLSKFPKLFAEDLPEVRALRQAALAHQAVAREQKLSKDAKSLARRTTFLAEGNTDYKDLLPQNFSTDIAVKLRMMPGNRVADLQRGIAAKVVAGDLSINLTSEELLDRATEIGIEELMSLGEGLKLPPGKQKGGRMSKKIKPS
ncbi:unnamed protein product [Chrysoparadoxa australica]